MKGTNTPIYCLSGLGADEKIFVNLRLNGYELKHIAWVTPEKDDTIQTYAARLAASITEDNAILLGVSFGGMVGVEIARQRPVSKLILISSVKSAEELPRWMRIVGRLKLNRMLPIRSFKITERIDNNRLGVSNEQEKAMVRAYRKAADRVYMEWAVNEILNWKSNEVPGNVVHIHGEADKIFPITNIRSAWVIKDATHMMVYNRGEEVSRYINKALQE